MVEGIEAVSEVRPGHHLPVASVSTRGAAGGLRRRSGKATMRSSNMTAVILMTAVMVIIEANASGAHILVCLDILGEV